MANITNIGNKLELPQYRMMMDYFTQQAEKGFEKYVRKGTESIYERLGGGPQLASMQTEASSKLLESIMGKRAVLAERELGRTEELEDIETTKEMTLQDWFNRFRMQGKQQRGTMKRQELAGTQAMERLERGSELQEELLKAQQDWQEEQSSKNILTQLLSAGANILTGGIAGAFKGGANVWQGMALGGSGMAQMSMMDYLMKKYKE